MLARIDLPLGAPERPRTAIATALPPHAEAAVAGADSPRRRQRSLWSTRPHETRTRTTAFVLAWSLSWPVHALGLLFVRAASYWGSSSSTLRSWIDVLLVAGAVKAVAGYVHFRCSTSGGQRSADRSAHRSLAVFAALQCAFAFFWVLAFAGLLPGARFVDVGLWFVPATSVAMAWIALRGLRSEECAR